MSMKHRVKKLEKSIGSDKGQCAECHFVPGAVQGFEINCPVHGADRMQAPADTKLCKTCGRSTTIAIWQCDCGQEHPPPPEPDFDDPQLTTAPE